MRILTIANQKGGVAKTTTAVTIAHGLAIKGRSTLLLDVDPQGQCAVALGREQDQGVFDLLVTGRSLREAARPTGRKNLYLVPSDKRTATAQMVLAAEGAGLDTLRRALRKRMNGYNSPDYILIDTAPSLGGLQEMAIWAADLVLIPCGMDYLSTDGVVKILETMQHLSGKGWEGALMGILPTFYDETTRESQATLDDLQKTFGPGIILPPIHRATVFRECVSGGKTIWERYPTSRAAKEYATVLWRVLDVR
ncbi:MAG: ParA family protein [Chloroflexia bacterium]|nr:ParA family protein [Chloroflexia bacterium]